MDAPRRPLLLLVEDDLRSARTLARMLREDGYEVEHAADGAAAVARLGRDPVPDAVVTDLMLPHVDGIAVARYARSRRSGVPIVVITGHPHLALGLSPPIVPSPLVLTKPLDYGPFAAAISNVLAPA
jgi:two-component system response regulator MprA